ncbi:MAG: cation-translocating P-type ATPase [Spirochaetota bacterium]
MQHYQRSAEQTLGELSTSADGLSDQEAASRLESHGTNELTETRGKRPLKMLWEQFTETMVLILIAAVVVSAFLGKGLEATAIGVIVVLFAVLGFFQEYRAERAIAALRKIASPSVRVRRDGSVTEIAAADLVPGDVVLVEAGNLIPADLRVIESASLRVQEAALTGESEPVEKHARQIDDEELPLGDRRNMLYLGTSATYGRGVAVVTDTGMATELGRIATMIQGVPSEATPLQRRLDQVGKALAVVGVVAAALVFGLGLLRSEPLADMFLTAISVAVAVVPEGLPAVVTISLAIGAQRMLRRNALIRKLPAVETLGSVTVICSDKTGTLTENRMTVTVLDIDGHRLELTEPIKLKRPVLDGGTVADATGDEAPAIRLSLLAGALCNDAVLKGEDQPGSYHAIGDPTEGALLIAAADSGLLQDELKEILPRIAELPFDSERKRMTTVHRLDAQDRKELSEILSDSSAALALTKGSVDGMLEISSRVLTAEGIKPMTDELLAEIRSTNEELATGGLRVLGFACRPFDAEPQSVDESLESQLIFVGMVGMIDPPREEVLPAIRTCREAGIRPVMITGDHPLTASAIARDLELSTGEGAVTGRELVTMDDQTLRETVRTTSVFARVSPEEKLRIIDALQAEGEVVSMTGDGVNDSPALKKADIGVAMGIAGTDVAKEASDMVLLDDNFATIVAAVEEGRVIFANLMRFIKFSLGGNIGKVLVMLGAPLLGINVALQPLQLLWLNLLTDGLLGMGLSLEPGDPNTMRQPPRNPNEPILNRPAKTHVAWVGLLIAVITLGVGAFFRDTTAGGEQLWQTMIFATLGFTQIGHALGLRAAGHSPFSITSNPTMMGLTVLTIGLQLAVIYLPFLDRFFSLTPLPIPYLAICLSMGLVTFLAVAVERRVLNRPRSAATM